jgi:hypothetical protein
MQLEVDLSDETYTKWPAAVIHCVQRWDTGCAAGVLFPVAVGDLHLPHSVHTDSVTHHVSSPMGTGGSLTRRKAAST